MSRDSLPALVDRRGADGPDGDAAVRPGQVIIQNTVQLCDTDKFKPVLIVSCCHLLP